MRDVIEACKVVIFDLDGTLYEGTSHFNYYAAQIQQELPAEVQPLFAQDYQSVTRGQHALTIGTVYDVGRDVILTLDPLTLMVREVRTWDGRRWAEGELVRTYPQPIAYNETDMIAVGDGWWLAYVTGAHYGAKDTYHCYNRTKEYMASGQFQLPQTPGLKEALAGMKGRKTLVLLTNSDRPDVQRLLRALELGDVFDLMITDAGKPVQTSAHLQHILHTYKVRPDEAVSIGDNFMNEIAPALQLGMHAVYITSHTPPTSYENFLTVPTLAGAFAE